MPSDYDATEFIDGDLQGRPSPYSAVASQFPRAPSREEVDAKVSETQQKLAELKRAQEELERERATLEETRRRQMEFHTGRQEVIQNLTRGLGLLEEAEFNARRDAEQMAKALGDMRDALGKVQAIHEETWTKDTFPVELTRGLTALENARMEWNGARLKFPVLSAVRADDAPIAAAPGAPVVSPLGAHSFGELCRFGFAMTWPLVLVALAGLGLLVALLLRR
ncbi:MAG TPA: hypothetical protein VG146_13115 [Verrucomicrobiae bacterium]|nr:hypothetical protein [Verrucomicrobiae bacterium]